MRPVNLPLYPDCYQRFVDRSGRVRTETTQEAVMIHLRKLQHNHPDKRVGDFTETDLKDYCQANKPAPKTQQTRRAILHMFFEWAEFEKLVKIDPSKNLKFLVQPGKYSVRRHNWLSAVQVKQLLTSLPGSTLVERRDRILVYVGLLTGLRSSNLSSLTWGMFDQQLSSIRIVSKGQQLKEFGVPDVLQTALLDWQAECRPHQGMDGPVFPAFHHETDFAGAWGLACQWTVGLGHGGVRLAIGKASRRAIAVELKPHDLRRSYASYLESEGFGLEDICRALGHANMATTSIYLDRNPDRAVAVGRSLKVNLA